jgi:hypothetical protein
LNLTTTHVLHDTNGLLGLSDKLVLSLLNFLLCLRAQLLLVVGLIAMAAEAESSTLGVSLDSIKREARVLNVLTGAGSETQVGVKGSVPASEEAALNLGILGKTSLANTLAGKRILLQGRRKRVFTGTSVVLVKELAARQTGAGDSMAESLGLGLGSGRSDEGGLGFGRGCCGGEEADLLADGAAKVLESLLDVRRVVVCLVGVLRAKESRSDRRSKYAITQMDI